MRLSSGSFTCTEHIITNSEVADRCLRVCHLNSQVNNSYKMNEMIKFNEMGNFIQFINERAQKRFLKEEVWLYL